MHVQRIRLAAAIVLAFTWTGSRPAAAESDEAPSQKAQRRRAFERYIESLDKDRISREYPQAIKMLRSDDPEAHATGIKTLAATGDLNVVAWLVPFLDSPDSDVRIWCGFHLQSLVAHEALKRRDPRIQDRVVILPRKPDDPDLTPLAWTLARMLEKPDDGNTHAYAATMIGYLGLSEFERNLRALLRSRHPAVTRSAATALEMLGLVNPTVMSPAELKAAQSTCETLAARFLAGDEDRLALLLLSMREFEQVNKHPRRGSETSATRSYTALVEGNIIQFQRLRATLRDPSKFTLDGIQLGQLDGLGKDAVRILRDSRITLAHPSGIQVTLPIAEMAILDGRCRIVRFTDLVGRE